MKTHRSPHHREFPLHNPQELPEQEYKQPETPQNWEHHTPEESDQSRHEQQPFVKSGSSLGPSPDEFQIKGMRTEGWRLALGWEQLQEHGRLIGYNDRGQALTPCTGSSWTEGMETRNREERLS